MSGFEIKQNVRKLLRDNYPKVFLISLVFIVLMTVMTTLQQQLPGTFAAYTQYLDRMSEGEIQSLGTVLSYFKPGGIPFAIVLWLLLPIIEAGYKSYCLKISRGQKGDLVDIFNGFLFFGKAILLNIAISFFTTLWTLLFIFPGIAAHYRYRQAFYILVDDPQKGVLQCIGESKRMMKGKKLDLFLLDLSFIGWSALHFLTVLLLPFPFPLPLVLIWLTPYYNLTCAAFYNQLIKELAV